MSELILEERPPLRQPVFLIAFTGWPDAAESASRAVEYVRLELGASRIGEIRADGFYDLTSVRPRVAIKGGIFRSLEYPKSILYAWRHPAPSGRDLLLLSANEPSLRWTAYVDAVLELAALYEAQGVYSFGSLFDGVAHTRPTRVSVAVSQPELRRRMGRLKLSLVDYEGPGSIHTALLDGCRRREMLGASFWGHVPVYAQVNWNARVSLSLLNALSAVASLSLDCSRLTVLAGQLDTLLDQLVADDADLQQQVTEYEQQDSPDPTSSLPSTEEILSEVEELLRSQHDDTAER